MADSVLDISHESLIRQWKRLSRWVEREAESAEIYRHLEQTVRLWKQGQAALWSTPDLENTLAWKERERPGALWAGRYGNHFELAMEFLEASTQAQAESRRQEEQARKVSRYLYSKDPSVCSGYKKASTRLKELQKLLKENSS
jgi:hypothetical protein